MPDPVKILHVLSSLDQHDGGPVRAVLDLSAASRVQDLESHLLAPGPATLDDNPLPAESIHVAPPSISRAFCYAPGLRRWLRRHVSEFHGVVIHGMWQYPGFAAAAECRRAGVPYACFPHGMLGPYPFNWGGPAKRIKKRLYWRMVESRVFAGAAATLFTTKRELENGCGALPAGSRRLIITPFGIDKRTRVVERPANDALWQAPDRRVALFLGRLHPIKNLEFLIEAWNRSKVAGDYHLVIAGPGDDGYVARLARLAAAGPHTERIHFPGYVAGDDKAYLLQRAQWFLFPSLYESFGVAVVEAVQAGCAVAVSDQVYLADYLSPESAVLDLRIGTWADFFGNRMCDDARRDFTAKADREMLEGRLTTEEVTRNWAQTFRELFSRA